MRVDLGDDTLNGLVDSLRENGQIQPIVLDADYNLIGGGRRYAAATKLGWTHIQAFFRESMPEHMRAELELEENIRRKQFTWQEQCLGIMRTHTLKRVADPTLTWGTKQTGEMLGVSHSHVGKLIKIGQLLQAGDKEVAACATLQDAITLLVTRRAAEVQALVTKRDLELRAIEAKKKAAEQQGQEPDELEEGEQTPTPIVDLSGFYHNADCIKHMKTMPANSVDHCITDIPYGIDMEMVQLKNIGLVEEQHDVEANVALFKPFLKGVFRVLRKDGFLLFFYDLKHDEMLRALAKEVGFSVCAWPLVWCKQHACKNDASDVNFTKATEYVMVCRKSSSAHLVKHQAVNYILASAAEDRKRYDNPFAKPQTVWRWLIDAVARPGQIVLDPFAGEMSCPLAVLTAGCQPYAIELVNVHYDKGIQHVQRALKLHHKGRVRFI
jgi:ParB/RepB/Spo0J family partition protein